MSVEIKHMDEIEKGSYLDNQANPTTMVTRFVQTNGFQYFFTKISHGGFLLFSAAVVAFIWSNIDAEGYSHFWHQKLTINLAGHKLAYSLHHWVNDALMTIFFFAVGLEIKRELLVGGLSDTRKAALPVVAALGGMMVPALFFVVINIGGDGISGWGIPMATDIAFSLAILSLLGKKIPFSVRLFLTAFAIADDLGAILVIAFFYTPSIEVNYLLLALLPIFILWALNYHWVRYPLPYVITGLFLWFFIAKSGLHATIAGVVVAMFIPAIGRFNTDIFLQMVRDHLDHIKCEDGNCGYTIMINRGHQEAVQAISKACRQVETPLQRMEHSISNWVAYVVLPLFALANAGVILGDVEIASAVFHPVALGVATGLFLGKPLGIFLFTLLAVRVMGIPLIDGMRWIHVLGIGFLGGVGFTMSLFISALSFTDPSLQEFAKVGIIVGSAFASIVGLLILKRA